LLRPVAARAARRRDPAAAQAIVDSRQDGAYRSRPIDADEIHSRFSAPDDMIDYAEAMPSAVRASKRAQARWCAFDATARRRDNAGSVVRSAPPDV
jgi:hypothetical protein